jgi:hypothetical protein
MTEQKSSKSCSIGCIKTNVAGPELQLLASFLLLELDPQKNVNFVMSHYTSQGKGVVAEASSR